MSKKNIHYDASLRELQSILAKLQEGNIGLEDMRQEVTKAMHLITTCRQQLRTMKEEIDQITAESVD
ncbi:MAG: exodeoxyribonuclease VII small subunit [Saprospiraceae bacterium]|nr:exodeoxyribonuclease VII small subunit [Saprospiraceae bacterium]